MYLTLNYFIKAQKSKFFVERIETVEINTNLQMYCNSHKTKKKKKSLVNSN